MESERIDTLVLPIEPKAARPPRLDRNGSVWAAAAKLGATWFDESAPAFGRVVNRRDVCLPVGLADCFQCGENGS